MFMFPVTYDCTGCGFVRKGDPACFACHCVVVAGVGVVGSTVSKNNVGWLLL